MMVDAAAPRILVVLTGSLGDVARGLAIINPIKRGLPGCRITWVVDSRHAPLVRLHPDIDRVVEFVRKDGWAGVKRLRRELRQESYDLALDLQRIFKSGLIALQSGAPRRIGFHRADAKEFNWLFSTETIPARGESLPKLTQYLDFLTPLGVGIPDEIDFGLSAIDRTALLGTHRAALDQRYVALLLGSAWPSKDWLPEGYSKLARLIAEQGLSVVLLGDGKAAALGERLRAELPASRIVNLAGKTTLTELIGAIACAAAAAGPDSGPGHVAAALGVPYVALFGATSPERTAPWGMLDLAVRSSIGCSPCYRRRCPGLGRTCMRLISPAEVLNRIKSVVP